ncbi:ABC transporter permease [Emticicia sp. BO119]|uniref:ABC transporter permease n=1 Tax=Emticicia sp. BO119 TaxID=2757768 RepID=UPI0015F0934D|nr:ABC transporter permease [Emticicia sp. BO119]MBA4849341.1 ABC transporter permease [Emticicia sp. BO119]
MNRPTPPKWADKLLSAFLPEDLLEELQGDMHEQFEVQAEDLGLKKAQWLYIWEVLRFCRPYFLKRRFVEQSNYANYSHPVSIFSPIMIRNYFTIAWRNLIRNKAFSAINIFGLSIGISCFMLIAVFVYHELSYDRYVNNADQIYRVNLAVTGNGNIALYPNVDFAVGDGIKNTFPEVKDFTRVSQAVDFVKYENNQFKEQHMAFAEANFIKMFSIPLLEGNIDKALVEPNSIVISKAMATKYFGDHDPIGKSLQIGTQLTEYKVTGLFDKVPDNSHFHFDAFLSMSTWHVKNPTWSNLGPYTYIELNKNTDAKKLESKFPQLVEKYVVPEIQRDMGISLAEAQKSVETFRFLLQPLTKLHLYGGTKYELEPGGDIQYIYIFSALAVFILLLACVNFTNLSTAQSAKRSKEVGIRKVLGSIKKQLILQFLAESVLLTSFAMLFAYLLIFLFLPYFNQLANKNVSFLFFLDYKVIASLFLVSFVSGIIAGIYPAFFLSSFGIIKTLKGMLFTGGKQKKPLQSSLIVFQFSVSTLLIIATIVVYQQLQHMQNKKLGYDKDQVIFMPDSRVLGGNQLAFQEQLKRDNRVVSASISRMVPGNSNLNGTQIHPVNENGNGVEIHIDIFNIDYDYINTLGMKIKQGRAFSKEFSTDSSGVIINESAVRELGWANKNPIGRSIVRSGQQEYKVLGVVQDFNYTSVKQKVAPAMMMLGRNYGGMVIKINTTDIEGFMIDLKKQWDSFNPAGPMEYYFLDEKFAALYDSEQRTQKIFSAFAFLAIIIASLGLFALSTFMMEQRKKEVGIRKVLGASVSGIVQLLVKDFLILVIISILIASPLAWYAMNQWLEDFAYKIDLQWWMFALAGILAIVIAILTVSFQGIKAALMNPVKSLKSE